jgi:hypothetical protein
MPKQIISVLLLVLVFSGVLSAQIVNVFNPEPHEGYDIKDGKIYFRRGDAGLILENASGETIAKFYADRGMNIGDPFSSLGGDMQTATIFQLTILNRSNGNVTFTPSYVTLKIKDEAFFPMDFTVLLDFIENQEKPMHDIIEKSVFHSPETIPAGKIVTKFLIFPALPKKFENLRLVFDYIFVEKNEIRMTFYFKRKLLSTN